MAHLQIKLKQLLVKLQNGTCKLNCDTYLNKLLTNIEDKEKIQSTEAGILLDQPVFIEWILQAADFWYINNTPPKDNIAVFTLNLATLLSRDELKFCLLNNQNFYAKIFEITKVQYAESSPSIKLAYIRILSSLLSHKPGITWLINSSNSYTYDILKFALTTPTIYITKESNLFIARLLNIAILHNINFVKEYIAKIIAPLSDLDGFRTTNQISEIDDEILRQQKSPILQLIANLLEYNLENCASTKEDFNVVLILFNDFLLEQRINDLILISRNRSLIFGLYKILTIKLFLELSYKIINGLSDSLHNDVKNTINKLTSEILQANISRGFDENVLKLCHLSHFYLSLMTDKINNKDECVIFINQVLIFQILPVVTLTLNYRKDCFKDEVLSEDLFRDEYLQKIFKMMCPPTLRIAYNYRNALQSRSNLFEMAIKSLVYVLQSRKYFSRENAATVFQCFIYALKDFVYAVNENPQLSVYLMRQIGFFTLHFEALAILIEEFNLKWKDSVETICVMNIACNFVNLALWPASLVVKVLKLVNIAFTKYMTPNLALLVDKMSDSSITLTGPLICAKLMDNEWEVRDTALEVVQTMSVLSKTKFPSLQKVLMDSDLPGLVVKMATADGESFVRATAIKCLQEMIQVEEIWNNSLKSQDLAGKMRHILVNETEGIVRVEAATFMCISYENNQFPEETLDKIYETMIHSSTSDLHWEVKVRALNFWDKVINNHLQHQGMIDGSFPNVTFSKEHRKIVTLTDAEIKKRLTKVLGQLSGIGCLGVLISAIRDDCDMEVSKTAVKITQKLLELLKKYNINADSSLPVSPQSTDNGMSSSASISSGVSADDFINSPLTPVNSDLNEEVINQIVNSRDSTLLQNVYAQSDYGSVINYDMQVRKIVSPNEFLLFTQQDLNVIINEKKNWLNGIEDLGSLLDDMLKSYDDDDVNSMDCY